MEKHNAMQYAVWGALNMRSSWNSLMAYVQFVVTNAELPPSAQSGNVQFFSESKLVNTDNICRYIFYI